MKADNRKRGRSHERYRADPCFSRVLVHFLFPRFNGEAIRYYINEANRARAAAQSRFTSLAEIAVVDSRDEAIEGGFFGGKRLRMKRGVAISIDRQRRRARGLGYRKEG
jgi:hypothetical protein